MAEGNRLLFGITDLFSEERKKMNDKTIFILSNKPVAIERLHLCSWDFAEPKGLFEIGLEFFAPQGANEIVFKIALPFGELADEPLCLKDSLIRDDDNCKSIFNDSISAIKPIKGDKRNGAIVEFSSRGKLAVLPVSEIEVNSSIISVKVKALQQNQITNYIRLCFKVDVQGFAVTKIGIAKKSFIYNIKVNELRNLTDAVNDLSNSGYSLCNTIKNCFCFHVFPSDYNIAYINTAKLKNIRILEAEAFNKYLPISRTITNNEYLIVFNKDSKTDKSGYSFFSEFEKETIGSKQIISAVALNILCSLLFAFSSLDYNPKTNLLAQIPVGYWIALASLIAVALPMAFPKNWVRRNLLKNRKEKR